MAAAITMLGAAARGDAPILPGSQNEPGRLNPSLANESRSAIDRGLAWITGRQRSDGSWAGTNRLDLTALPVLLLSFSPDPAHRPLQARGHAFLETAGAPHSEPEGLWAVLALTQGLAHAEAPAETQIGRRLFHLTASGVSSNASALHKAYADLATHPELVAPHSLSAAAHENLLLLALALARSGQNRIPLPNGDLLLWRPTMARALINRQNVEPREGAVFWAPHDNREPEAVLAATCHALLTLHVLLAD